MRLKFPIFIILILSLTCQSFAHILKSDIDDPSWYKDYSIQTPSNSSPSFSEIETTPTRLASLRPASSPSPSRESLSVPSRDYTTHVSCYYTKIIDLLERFGFTGPFAEELAKFALLRQLIEDGTNRSDTVSMVGMVPGGINKRVVEKMGLKRGEINEHGLKLSQVTANDGQGSYAVYGPLANVWSCLAIVLVWDEYVNGGQFSISPELAVAWNESKKISRRIAEGQADPDAVLKYEKDIAERRTKAIKRVNAMYGPGSSSIEGLVKNLEPAFSLNLKKLRESRQIGQHLFCLTEPDDTIVQLMLLEVKE
jgi:hypothetical protein